MATSFTLEGNLRSDGLIRFTCDELPGFRLLLKAREDNSAYNEDLKEAIVAFVPLFFAAEARSKSIGIEHKERSRNDDKGQGFGDIAYLIPTKPQGSSIMTERELDHLTFWISGALLCCVGIPVVVLIIGAMLS